MHALLIILFMMIIGAVIGGVTNMIAVRMLFHPFKPYFILGKRLPFTPGLIPKRREEIATKIGEVIEEHLLTESLIKAKLNEPKSREAIDELMLTQVRKLRADHVTLQYFAEQLDVNAAEWATEKVQQWTARQTNTFYQTHRDSSIRSILPQNIMHYLDSKVDHVPDLLFDRAKVYLRSDKGAADINQMLDTFFQEKGKIIGLLQMFMTKEHIAERIRTELIRLTSHPQAKRIAVQVIENEYETLKQKKLEELVSEDQFATFSNSLSTLALQHLDIKRKAHTPLQHLMPSLLDYLETNVASHLTSMIINYASGNISSIMQKVNLRGMVEEQINTFDLDYIERLIIDIANKELKLIMLLGFLLGGIIGCLQGIIAIFV